MECFESVVVAGGQGGRFQPVSDQWYEDCVVYSKLPLECEVCVENQHILLIIIDHDHDP